MPGRLKRWRFLWSEREALGCLIVLAGSLTKRTIAKLLPLEPDFVAVRGAACAGRRDGNLDPRKVRRLVGCCMLTKRRGFTTETRRHGEDFGNEVDEQSRRTKNTRQNRVPVDRICFSDFRRHAGRAILV